MDKLYDAPQDDKPEFPATRQPNNGPYAPDTGPLFDADNRHQCGPDCEHNRPGGPLRPEADRRLPVCTKAPDRTSKQTLPPLEGRMNRVNKRQTCPKCGGDSACARKPTGELLCFRCHEQGKDGQWTYLGESSALGGCGIFIEVDKEADLVLPRPRTADASRSERPSAEARAAQQEAEYQRVLEGKIARTAELLGRCTTDPDACNWLRDLTDHLLGEDAPTGGTLAAGYIFSCAALPHPVMPDNYSACFPAQGRDELERVVGLSQRYLWPTRDGKNKFTAKGTGNGLFYDPSHDWSRPMTILHVEGASNVAACETADCPAIGRPSNTDTFMAGRMASRFHPDSIHIIPIDNDQKSDGRHPGKEGAEKYAKKLIKMGARNVFLWPVPASDGKDMRDYFRAEAARCGGGAAGWELAGEAIRVDWMRKDGLTAVRPPRPRLDDETDSEGVAEVRRNWPELTPEQLLRAARVQADRAEEAAAQKILWDGYAPPKDPSERARGVRRCLLPPTLRFSAATLCAAGLVVDEHGYPLEAGDQRLPAALRLAAEAQAHALAEAQPAALVVERFIGRLAAAQGQRAWHCGTGRLDYEHVNDPAQFKFSKMNCDSHHCPHCRARLIESDVYHTATCLLRQVPPDRLPLYQSLRDGDPEDTLTIDDLPMRTAPVWLWEGDPRQWKTVLKRIERAGRGVPGGPGHARLVTASDSKLTVLSEVSFPGATRLTPAEAVNVLLRVAPLIDKRARSFSLGGRWKRRKKEPEWKLRPTSRLTDAQVKDAAETILGGTTQDRLPPNIASRTRHGTASSMLVDLGTIADDAPDVPASTLSASETLEAVAATLAVRSARFKDILDGLVPYTGSVPSNSCRVFTFPQEGEEGEIPTSPFEQVSSAGSAIPP